VITLDEESLVPEENAGASELDGDLFPGGKSKVSDADFVMEDDLAGQLDGDLTVADTVSDGDEFGGELGG